MQHATHPTLYIVSYNLTSKENVVGVTSSVSQTHKHTHLYALVIFAIILFYLLFISTPYEKEPSR